MHRALTDLQVQENIREAELQQIEMQGVFWRLQDNAIVGGLPEQIQKNVIVGQLPEVQVQENIEANNTQEENFPARLAYALEW